MAEEKVEGGKTAPVLNFSKKHREPAKEQEQEAHAASTTIGEK